ncbi:AAA family ATPase, partial [Streptomyces sp. NPDC059900]
MRRDQRSGDHRHSTPAPAPRPGNLPLELNAFVGRTAELAALTAALESARLITVTGVGGVGKSRLAVRAAADRAPRDGAWLVELSAVRDPDLVEHAVADALRLTDHTHRTPRKVIVDHLAQREVLLVVDGFEHLVEACSSLVRDLLHRCPGLRV